jgi:PAS domain S-box-containing protein
MEKFRRSSWSGYVVAMLAVALTLGMLFLIPPLREQPFFLFTVAVALSAWYGGLKPGLLATCLSVAVVDFFFLQPTWSLSAGLADLFRLGVFALLALIVSSLNGQRLKALEELRRADEELQQRILERTADLAKTNEDLQTEIAERRQAEIALRASEGRLRRLVETSLEGIWTVDVEGKTDYVNQRAAGILGYTVDEMLGRSPLDFLFPKDVPDGVEKLESRKQGVRGQLDYRMRRKDGSEIWVRSNSTPIFGDQGEYLGALAMFTDITEQRRIEAQLLRAQRLESLGRLAGGIAHDLNNVLAPILISINMLRRELTGEKERRRLETMRQNVLRGSDLIKQVLTFARGTLGEKVTLPAAPLFKEVVKLLRETLTKTISIEAAIADDLWPVTGDATQLHQLLMNLCVNARDAMPQGGRLKIEAENLRLDEAGASMRPGARPGRYIRLRVADSGVGIPAAILDSIFDPFFTTKEVGKGTGLGLSTAQGIVKGHGGFIEVESKAGQGAQFRVYLPAADTAQLRPAARAEAAAPAGHGETILVVDDEQPVRESLREMLESSGYRALTACDGTEAVALYSLHQSDIRAVLMDLVMPQMDGLTAFRALKKISPEVKVIATSGLVTYDRADEALREGASAFLAKPYNAEALLKALAEALEVSQSDAEQLRQATG